ncbi:MAG: ASKHA domain-containing protein [Lachnospiraceae bacterium]|nr:ASKHA domain-containing protein [Lachnospiraceae bacterium]
MILSDINALVKKLLPDSGASGLETASTHRTERIGEEDSSHRAEWAREEDSSHKEEWTGIEDISHKAEWAEEKDSSYRIENIGLVVSSYKDERAEKEENSHRAERIGEEDSSHRAGKGGSPQIIVSGNTTMQHLLEGLPCKGLGVAPYSPVDISLHPFQNMILLPGISTFVGADIVSGILSCGMDLGEDICLFVDLGTNGEIVLGNRDRLICASTAAGPAFEGGNISCGVAGIPGAIDRVDIIDHIVRYTSLGGRKPVGLCGTGVLEVTYELLKSGIMDETGLLSDPYFEKGFRITGDVIFRMEDIREVQLAKGAVRAGIETLIESYGIHYGNIQKLYLAGGFGKKLNIRKAAGIGLIPFELLERTEAVGNSSLKGAVEFAAGRIEAQRFIHVADFTEEISLGDHPSFQEQYFSYMNFPPITK